MLSLVHSDRKRKAARREEMEEGWMSRGCTQLQDGRAVFESSCLTSRITLTLCSTPLMSAVGGGGLGEGGPHSDIQSQSVRGWGLSP